MKYLKHTVMAVAAQGALYATGVPLSVGCAAASMFFIGREVTQAEYRWIEHYGIGLRANMGFWDRFDPRVWKPTDVLDWVLPAVVTSLVAYFL